MGKLQFQVFPKGQYAKEQKREKEKKCQNQVLKHAYRSPKSLANKADHSLANNQICHSVKGIPGSKCASPIF